MIGAELMSAIATTNFRVPGQVFPHLRVALWANMASTDKHQDGFSKVLNKSDVEKLRGQNLAEKIQACEGHLAEAWKECQGVFLI